MRRGTNLPAVGSFNQSVILEVIRRAHGGISRAEIAVQTGLVAQTVSNATKQLIEQGIVVEAGTVIQGPGKPPVILRLEPRSRFAVGVHIDPGFIAYVLVDLAGQVIAQSTHKTPSPKDPEAVIAEIVDQIGALAQTVAIDRTRILGIGLATPGPIDAVRGVVVDPPLMMGWWEVPIRDAVAAATGLDVIFDKEVVAAAAAEVWFEPGRRNFVLIYLGAGIGTGIVIDGNVLRGATSNAGDGGRIIVNDSGVPGAPTQQLGHLVTPECLVRQAVEEGVLPADGSDMQKAFERLLTEAEQGRPNALAILQRAGRNIASAVLTFVNLLDVPEFIFVGPYWDRLKPLILPTIAYVVQTSPLRSTRHAIRFSESRVGFEVPAVGAACLALDTLLSPRTTSLLIAAGN